MLQQQILKVTKHADEIAFIGTVLDLLKCGDTGAAVRVCMERVAALELVSKPVAVDYHPALEAA